MKTGRLIDNPQLKEVFENLAPIALDLLYGISENSVEMTGKKLSVLLNENHGTMDSSSTYLDFAKTLFNSNRCGDKLMTRVEALDSLNKAFTEADESIHGKLKDKVFSEIFQYYTAQRDPERGF